MAAQPPGALVISLDFELHWGVFDSTPLAEYHDALYGARTAIPKILSLFNDFGIHATWAVVGALCAEGREHFLALAPPRQPAFANMKRSAYHQIVPLLGKDEQSDPLHFGRSLVMRIMETPHQEIASHTFAHYYCAESGADPESFRDDLHAAQRAFASLGRAVRTIVFPRNQVTTDMLRICSAEGLRTYRGNLPLPAYMMERPEAHSLRHRAYRLADAYLPLAGSTTTLWPRAEIGTMTDICASRFLRPWAPWDRALQPLKLHRIFRSLEFAARRGEIFHLWWHPHNFGRNSERNLDVLRLILLRYKRLAETFGMQSATMDEAATRMSQLKDGTVRVINS